MAEGRAAKLSGRHMALPEPRLQKTLDNRMAALLIDLLLGAILIVPITMLTERGAPGTVWDFVLSVALTALAWDLSLTFVWGAFESSKFQATPGKLACGLRVVGTDGGRILFKTALRRNFVKCFVPMAVNAVAWAVALSKSADAQPIHDRRAGTRVIVVGEPIPLRPANDA
jgi:uncharacterized RDD family membrane protein YckC